MNVSPLPAVLRSGSLRVPPLRTGGRGERNKTNNQYPSQSTKSISGLDLSARLTADGRRAAFRCLRFRPEAERRTPNVQPRTLNKEGRQATQSHPKAI